MSAAHAALADVPLEDDLEDDSSIVEPAAAAPPRTRAIAALLWVLRLLRNRRVAVPAAAILGLWLIRRDRARRAAGIERRTLRRAVAEWLAQRNSGIAHQLSSYIRRHPVQFYAAAVLLTVLALKYSQLLRRLARKWWRRSESEGELTEYPDAEEEDMDRVLAERGEVRVPGEAHDEDSDAGSIGLDIDGVEVDEKVKILRFLHSMRHISCLEESAFVDLYSRMRRLTLPRGALLFRRGDDSDDGLYVVLSGRLGIYDVQAPLLSAAQRLAVLPAPSSGDAATLGPGRALVGDGRTRQQPSPPSPPPPPHSSPLPLPTLPAAADAGRAANAEPAEGAALPRLSERVLNSDAMLCTFSKGQTVGENSLLAGPGDRRVVTCAAVEPTAVLQLNRRLFDWFTDHHVRSFIAFLLTTTARQWRVAHYVLIEFLSLPEHRHLAFAPPLPNFGPRAESPAPLSRIAAAAAGTVNLEPGDELFAPGDPADCLYVVLKGALHVHAPGSLHPVPTVDAAALPGAGSGSSAAAASSSRGHLGSSEGKGAALRTMGRTGSSGLPRASPAFTALDTPVSAAAAFSPRFGATSAPVTDPAVALLPPPLRLPAVAASVAPASAAALVSATAPRHQYHATAPSLALELPAHAAAPTAGQAVAEAEAAEVKPTLRRIPTLGSGRAPSPSLAATDFSSSSSSASAASAASAAAATLPSVPGPNLASAMAGMDGTPGSAGGAGSMATSPSGDAGGQDLVGRVADSSEGGVSTLGPGCIVGGIACFTGTAHREAAVCVESGTQVAVFPKALFTDLVDSRVAGLSAGRAGTLTELALAVAASLTPLLRAFLAAGLQRIWLHAGEVLFRQGGEADGLFVVTSGRVRCVVHARPARRPAQGSPLPSLSGEFGAAITSDTGHDGAPLSVSAIEVARGESVGEIGLLTEDRTRWCSAVCIRDTELVFISRNAFNRLVQRYPAVLAKFTRVMANRLSQHLKQMSASAEPAPPRPLGVPLRLSRHANVTTIALVPAGSNPAAAIPLRDFGTQLAAALRALDMGEALLLNSELVDSELGAGTCDALHNYFENTKVSAWLAVQEEASRFVVLQADPSPTPWTRCCVRQADVVLLVGNGTRGSPGLSDVETSLLFSRDRARRAQPGHRRGSRRHSSLAQRGSGLWPWHRGSGSGSSLRGGGGGVGVAEEAWGGIVSRSFAQKELLLLHEHTSKRPHGTRQWLRARAGRGGVRGHHHLRCAPAAAAAADIARLARHLAGRSIGLVLGGGGSRGLAHLGALQAMRQLRLPVDCVGGTSQGACMGALFAMTLDMGETEALLRRLASKMGSVAHLLSDFTLPLISYFSGANFNELLQELYGDAQIEDLWLPFYCISTNVTQANMAVHDTGPVWRYVRASMTIMGMLPPMLDHGDLLIDGGYVNNLPVDVMRARGAHMVVAVDVEDKDNSAFVDVHPYGDSLSGWWLLGKWVLSLLRLAPRVRIPRLADTSLSVAYISHNMTLRHVIREGQRSDRIVYLRPDVQHFKLLDYHRLSEIQAAGYAVAIDGLRRWKLRQMQLGAWSGARIPNSLLPRSDEASQDSAGEQGGGGMTGMKRVQSLTVLPMHRRAVSAVQGLPAAPAVAPEPLATARAADAGGGAHRRTESLANVFNTVERRRQTSGVFVPPPPPAL